jgi:hypothetical protein
MTRRLVVVAALLAFGGSACEPSGGGAPSAPGQSSGALDQEEDQVIRPSGPDPVSTGSGGPVSVRLTVRVHRNGATEVVDAVELPGILKQEQGMERAYLYEAHDARGIIAVRALDMDFEARPYNEGQPHGELGKVDEELIHVDLPGISLARARGVSLRLARITDRHPEKIATKTTFDRLTQTGKLQPFAEVRSAQIEAAVTARSLRVVPAQPAQPARP